MSQPKYDIEQLISAKSIAARIEELALEIQKQFSDTGIVLEAKHHCCHHTHCSCCSADQGSRYSTADEWPTTTEGTGGKA